MKRFLLFFIAISISCTNYIFAQRWGRIISGAAKAYQAYSISDADMASYVKDYITELDASSNVCKKSSKYSIRINRLTKGLTSANGIKLNFKVYQTKDVNAFACPEGSIRIYSGLLDIMSDEEVLGVIGHEIGHIANKDSKDAFKNALMTSALMDGVSAFSYKANIFTSSILGQLSEAYLNASYSRKQEYAADDYGYNFLKKHGKNPRAMAKALQKLKSLQENPGSSYSEALLQLFSTHPNINDRVARMKQKAQREGYL